MSGIYLHIPFCKQACHYCNFHFSTSMTLKDDMIKAMTTEIKLRHQEMDMRHLKSIYLGGGTPSLLDTGDLVALFDTLAQYFTWDTDTEITLEANPDDITKEKLLMWKNAGIGRLSIGIQSFHDEELKWMNRAHHAAEGEHSVLMAQDTGFQNLTIDLIYGSPWCTESLWNAQIDKALDLRVPHISAYNLTVEENTALHHFVKKGKSPDVDTAESERHFLTLMDRLEDSGFVHYEISNFGLPDYLAVHNSHYWKGGHYLGIGPSAHSYDGVVRKSNVAHNPKYIQALFSGNTAFEVEVLDAATRYNEAVMTGLRTMWGVDVQTLRDIDSAMAHYFLMQIESGIHKKWVEKKGDVYTLTREGKLWADNIAVDVFWVE